MSLVVKSGERLLKMKGSETTVKTRPQIIIVPPGFLKTPVKIAKISPKEPLKRPAPPLDNSSLNPVRKRANLDHLSSEEKLLRRKLKNRVAAQNARDKKRVKMDDMEDEILLLRKRNAKLEEENRRLREVQPRLQPFSLPLSPASSTEECDEHQQLSTIILENISLPDTKPSPPAERVNDLQQKGRATILGAVALLCVMLMSSLLSLARKNPSRKLSTRRSLSYRDSPPLLTMSPLSSSQQSKTCWDSRQPWPGPRMKPLLPLWSNRTWRRSLRVI